MERGTKIGIAALIIAAVAVPTVVYGLGQYLLSQTIFFPPLSLKVEIAANQYVVGEVMDVSFTLANIARRSLLLTFPDTQTFDFSVKDSKGETIYVWSWDKGFLQMIVEDHLDPWQSIQMTLSWTPDTPGVYTLTGYTVTFWIGSWEDGEQFSLTAQPIQFVVIG